MMTKRGPTRLATRGAGLAERRLWRGTFEEISYEILPFKGTEDNVLANVPRDIRLTVTATEAKGLEPTIDLAVRLAQQGYRSAPHLAARLVRDRAHLGEIIARLDEVGVDGVFVVGGDAAAPGGAFPDALSLLEAMNEVGHRFTRVGIGGYPEGHGHIAQSVIEQALQQKSLLSTLIITQLCFSPETTLEWARSLHTSGIPTSIRVGIPGAVSRQKLVRISGSLGLGQSARFLKKQQGMFWRFFLPGGYSPDRLITGLAGSVGSPDNHIKGFHVFTFNELEQTERWRQDWLRRLDT